MTPAASETTQYPRRSPRASTLRALRIATGAGLPSSAAVTRETISFLSDMLFSLPLMRSRWREPAHDNSDALPGRLVGVGVTVVVLVAQAGRGLLIHDNRGVRVHLQRGSRAER